MCKKLIYLVSFVLVLGLTLTSTAGADLIGYWPLDEGAGTTVADVSGAGHHGMFAEGTPEWVEGMFGKALNFNGSNKVEIPDHPDFHLEDAVSMALWIKPEDNQPDYAKPFIKQKSDEYPYAIQYGTDQQIRATVNASARFDGTRLPNFPGEWAHLCMTYDGSALILYKDGEEVGRIAASGKLQQNDLSLSIGGRLGSSQNFIGIIDDVRLFSHALTAEEIQQVMQGPPAGPASKPSPADEATDVPRDVVLGWTPGEFASPINGQKVYFSENLSDVNDGIGGIAQDANSYAPELLAFGTTYYWRVDEVNNVNPESPWTGDVWSFTTEPIAYPIQNIIATASSSGAGRGPENTVNGSGLDDSGLLHDKVGDNNMWLSSITGPQPTWIEYEFDRVYKLHQMWVWNSNESMEPVLGLGCKDVSIEYSVDGTDYTPLGTTAEFARAPGVPDYEHNTTIDFGGAAAKYVRLTVNSNWGGILPQYGLSEVRFFYIPVWAREPSPDSGATDVDPDVVLGFRAGREAATHDVYLSTDGQAVIDGTAGVATMTEADYDAGALELSKTYYWKINEVNEAETPTTWESDLWSFATREFLIVDDIESYNDLNPDDPESNRIFNVWIDGYGVTTNGSLVGYDVPPFAEQSIVHSDRQSMPLFYDNSGTARYSEAELTLSPAQDWTKYGVKALSLWFHGDPNNAAEQMYVKVNGSKVVYDGDAADIRQASWQGWNIDLALFGASLQNVTKLSIGVGDETGTAPGGSGKMLFDDIRLYPSRCILSRRSADFAKLDYVEDCAVNYGEFEVMAGQWLLEELIPGGAEEIWFEAESADTIGASWRIYDDPNSSGGKHIGSENGDGNDNDNPPGAEWVAVYNFTVSGGVYKILLRGQEADSDSFWVRIPDATNLTPGEDPDNLGTGWVRFNGMDAQGGWNWDEVHSDDHDRQVANWTLPGGTHTLEIAKREDGTWLDAILITDNLDLVPVTLSPMSADLNEDKKVDFKDYAVLADAWLDEQPWPRP